MSATTVKLEAGLLREIRSVKPKDKTLTAYVREAVERDVMRRKLRQAAEQYQSFLRDHPAEEEDMDAWERAPLATPPRGRRP
jgi:hypothetical protein